jgi:predicted nuclease of predicted toxin-antitoxin system
VTGGRFVVDENISPTVAQGLRERGYHAVHVGDVGLRGTEDAVILLWAADNGCAVITHDHDYIQMLQVLGATSPSVVKLVERDFPGQGREGVAGSQARLARLTEVLPGLGRDLAAGVSVTLDGRGLVSTPLPLARPPRGRRVEGLERVRERRVAPPARAR